MIESTSHSPSFHPEQPIESDRGQYWLSVDVSETIFRKEISPNDTALLSTNVWDQTAYYDGEIPDIVLLLLDAYFLDWQNIYIR